MNFSKTILRSPDGDGASGGSGSGASGSTGGTGVASGTTGSAAGVTTTTGSVAASGTGAASAAAGAGSAAPAPYYKGLYGDDGKFDKTAFDRLPEHLKAHAEVFKKYENVDALLTGFGNAHALASKKALTPLDPNAPQHVKDERKAMLDQVLNVPKDPKGYGITRPETLPEQFWNQAGADEFGLIAQKHSISPEAVKDLLALQLKMTNGEIEKGAQMDADIYRKQDEAFATAIRTQGIDEAKAMDLATRGAMTLGIDPKSPLFKYSEIKLAALRMARLVGEDKLVTGDGSGEGGGKSHLEEARDIMRNPANPLHKAWADPMDPRNEEVRARVNELYRMDGEAKKKRGIPAP